MVNKGDTQKEATKGSCPCPFCDGPVEKPYPFCKDCGRKVEFCSECGKPLPPDTRICPECGQ
jgi:predicted amidophosphoribosyltransferase